MDAPSKWVSHPKTIYCAPRPGKKRVVTDGFVDKSLKLTIIFMILSLVTLLMAGCCPYSDHVSVNAIRPAADLIMDRHDGYVVKDPALNDLQRKTYLGTTTELRGVLDQAQGQ